MLQTGALCLTFSVTVTPVWEGRERSRKISSFINLTYDFGELLEAVLLDSFWTLLAKLIAAHKINFLH